MNLTEKKFYFVKVGLFCHNFNEVSAMFGNGKRILTGCPVMFDQRTDDGWYIFQVEKNIYVKIPEYDLQNEISEIPIEECELLLSDEEKSYYYNYNEKIEEENGQTA